MRHAPADCSFLEVARDKGPRVVHYNLDPRGDAGSGPSRVADVVALQGCSIQRERTDQVAPRLLEPVIVRPNTGSTTATLRVIDQVSADRELARGRPWIQTYVCERIRAESAGKSVRTGGIRC